MVGNRMSLFIGKRKYTQECLRVKYACVDWWVGGQVDGWMELKKTAGQ